VAPEAPLTTAPELAKLVVADAPGAWRDLGFSVDDGGRCRIGRVDLDLAGPDTGRGIVSWVLASQADREPAPAHPNGTVTIDHLVMTTPDPERTIAELEAMGMEHRRTRHADDYAEPMRQDFFRLGEVILEVIGPRRPDPARADRTHRLYGLAFTVEDLDATAAHLGERLGAVKDAVQPGRRIATLRRGLAAVPIAFMSAGPGAVGAS
jgi:hypothetical protein